MQTCRQGLKGGRKRWRVLDVLPVRLSPFPGFVELPRISIPDCVIERGSAGTRQKRQTPHEAGLTMACPSACARNVHLNQPNQCFSTQVRV